MIQDDRPGYKTHWGTVFYRYEMFRFIQTHVCSGVRLCRAAVGRSVDGPRNSAAEVGRPRRNVGAEVCGFVWVSVWLAVCGLMPVRASIAVGLRGLPYAHPFINEREGTRMMKRFYMLNSIQPVVAEDFK